VIDNTDAQPLIIKPNGTATCCSIFKSFFSALSHQFQAVEIIAIFNFIYIERIKNDIYVAQTLLDFDKPFRRLFTCRSSR